MQLNTLLFLVGIFSCGHVVRSEDKEAPYTVEIDNFEISTEFDQKYVNWDTLGLQKRGRNRFVIEGRLTLNRNLADDQKVIAIIKILFFKQILLNKNKFLFFF